MEIKDVVEHKVISLYDYNMLYCISDPKERMNKLIENYKEVRIRLEILKKERDRLPDSSYFPYHYFPLFNLYVSNIENFSKFILGEDINKILIKRKEIEQGIQEIDEYGTTYENRQLYFNAYSNKLSGNVELSQEEILKLVKERSIFLFNDPIKEIVTQKLDFFIGDDDKYKIYTLSEDVNKKGKYQIKNRYLCHLLEDNKDIVRKIRNSLTDEKIDLAKEELREMDFGRLEEGFRASKKYHQQQQLVYEELETEANSIRKGKTLIK